MQLVKLLSWSWFWSLVLYNVTAAVGSENVQREQHVVKKRSESHIQTDFMRSTFLVDEGVGTLVDTVCVKGGYNGRRFTLFSARGSAERCSRGPCPDATENTDFVRVYVDDFLIHPGELLCFNVTILEDSLVEGREFFILGLLDLRWGEVLTTATVTIEDNDSPSLESNRGVVLESMGSFEVCIRGGSIALPLVVLVANTSDLMETTESFTIAPEERRCVSINVVDDELYEGWEEAQVQVRSANVSIGNFSETFLITIVDDDQTPQFEQKAYIVNEGDGQIEVCVVFPADPSISVVSTLVIRDGSAKKGSDYLGSNDSFPISGGERKCNTITIVEDDNSERSESFVVTLNSSNSELSQPFQARVTIQDNDVIEFQQSVYTVVEDELGVDVCVLLPGQTLETKNGIFSTISGTATARLDYFPLVGIPFNISGSEKECFFVFNYMDKIAEGQEEFQVRVYTLLTPQFAIDVRMARIIVVDDDSIPCGNLTEPVNGKILSYSDENMPGSEVEYVCDFGFQLVGLDNKIRTCQPSGEWTGIDPSCEVILCPVLKDPTNGKVSVTTLTVNSQATYSCDSGYALDGDTTRVCLNFRGGIWSGRDPVCKLIVCPVLSSPINGSVILPDVRTPGSVAMYVCSNGSLIAGDDMRVCSDIGIWNGTEPACISIGALTLREPVTLKLVNDTPQINGSNVTVDFTVSGPVAKVICTLDDKKIEEDFTSRTKGGMNFTDVIPGGHTMEVIVFDLVNEERAHVTRFFEIGSQPDFCGLHLINEGVVVDRHRVRVQFAAVPQLESYWCKLDYKTGFNCGTVVKMSGLRPGRHHLKITPYKDECGYRRQLYLHFVVENTPDNPYNNL